MADQLRCVIMRGGTSKAVFLKEGDLPADEAARTRTILAVFGSPDKRQIDGLGGADPLTSKLAIIGPPRLGEPRAAGTHLTYTFGQVEITHPEIDWLSLCGNISSAVGAFGVAAAAEAYELDARAGADLTRALATLKASVDAAHAAIGELLAG